MAETTKSRVTSVLMAIKKGGVRKGVHKGTPWKRSSSASPVGGGVDKEVVRLRTFPSETSRRLMATMALASDNPRALMRKEGVSGAIGLVDMLPGDVAELLNAGVGDEPGNGVDVSVRRGTFPAEAKSGKKRKPKPRSCFQPSRGQMAKTFSKCLPKQDANRFEDLFKEFQSVGECPPGCDNRGVDADEVIIKLRVLPILWALQRLYGVGNVVCEKCDHMNADRDDTTRVTTKHDYLEIVAMDAVLSRTLSAPKRVTGTELVDTPAKYRVDREELLDAKFDSQFRAFVVVVPDAATYYCHRDRRNDSVGVANALIPMDTSWLRVVKNGDSERRFAGGGYVSRLWDGQSFWKFKVSRGESNFELKPAPKDPAMGLSWHATLPTLQVLLAFQCPDELGPCLPPDFVGGNQYDDSSGRTKSFLKRLYRRALMRSKAARRGCRHYARTFLHHHIDPKETLIIDPKDGDIDLRVAIQVQRPDGKGSKVKKGHPGVALSRESVVSVRYLPHLGGGADKLVADIRDHARMVTKGGKKSARAGCGDRGYMYPVGSRIMLDRVRRRRYKTSEAGHEQGPLRKSVIASARLAAVTIPGVLRIIQDAEEDGAIDPPVGGMNGDGCFCRISHSMDISVDLENASHYDSNDASQGFSIWTEDEPGGTRNWYFVLPNVYGKWPGGATGKNGTTFQGVAIKLTHGTLISWDGRVIRHCTSVAERPDLSKHVYGTFFAAKSSVVAYGARMSLMKKLRALIGRPQSGDLGVVPDAVGNGQHVADDADEAGGTKLLSAPIARKRKAGVEPEAQEGDRGIVDVGNGDVNVTVGGGANSDDDKSWDGHSYASHVSHDSGTADSIAMSVGDTQPLMHEICIDDDEDDGDGDNDDLTPNDDEDDRDGDNDDDDDDDDAVSIRSGGDERPPEPTVLKPSGIIEVHMQSCDHSTHGHRMHSDKGDYKDSEPKNSDAGVCDNNSWRQVDGHYQHPTHPDERNKDHPEQCGYARLPDRSGRGCQERYDERRTHSDIRNDRGWREEDRYRQHHPTRSNQHDHQQDHGKRGYAPVRNDGGQWHQERYDERQTHSDRRQYGHAGRGYAGVGDHRGWRQEDRYCQQRPMYSDQPDYRRHPEGQQRQEHYDKRRTHSDQQKFGHPGRGYVGVCDDREQHRQRQTHSDEHNYRRPERSFASKTGDRLRLCEEEEGLGVGVVAKRPKVDDSKGNHTCIIADGVSNNCRGQGDEAQGVVDAKQTSEPEGQRRIVPAGLSDTMESLVSGDVDDRRLVDVETHDLCKAKCNMMWNLRNSMWIPRFNMTDWRYAHPGEVLDKSNLPDLDSAMKVNPLSESVVSNVSNNGFGCNASLFNDLTLQRALGWVQCIKKKVPGSSKKKSKCTLSFPWEVTKEVMKHLGTVVVPCQHLQLFFQIMMQKTLELNETVAVGYVRRSKKVEQYYVERLETRTPWPLQSWDEEDCESLLQFWETKIEVCYLGPGEHKYAPVKDTMGDVGVNDTKQLCTSLQQGFTPAVFLGCSYICICEKLPTNTEFTKRLTKAFIKRMPIGLDVRMQRTSQYHVIQQCRVGYEDKDDSCCDTNSNGTDDGWNEENHWD